MCSSDLESSGVTAKRKSLPQIQPFCEPGPSHSYQVQVHTACSTKVNKLRDELLGARNSNFIQKASRRRRWWTSVPKNHLTSVRIQDSFTLKRGRDVIGCCKFLGVGILYTCSFPPRSGHDVPVNLQQDSYSLFCNVLSLYEWKNLIPLKVRALRMGYPVYFRL